MLVASMTDLEAVNEVAEDLPRLQRSTDRWVEDYLKIRRKLKIPRNQPFLKKFPSTYKNKNPWVTVMFKPVEHERVIITSPSLL
jgi:hypothetical protein